MQLFLEKIMSDVQAVLTILERRPPFLRTHSLYWACATIIKVILQVQSLYYKKKILQILFHIRYFKNFGKRYLLKTSSKRTNKKWKAIMLVQASEMYFSLRDIKKYISFYQIVCELIIILKYAGIIWQLFTIDWVKIPLINMTP